ncbi:MAG TPA: DsbA family protein [Devosiaceae bacterium]
MTIDFWFSIGSTYSFLSVMRLADLSKETRIGFIWRPFNVRAIMKDMNNIPFTGKPVKAQYMWRDIERRAAARGLAPKLPAPYPLAALELANQVAAIAEREGWCEAYTVATYRRWFEDAEPAGSEPNLSASIAEAGEDPERVLAEAEGAAGVVALAENTDEARRLGIFGSPSFVVGTELFWGDDRLEDAMAWHHNGRLD